MDHYNVKYTETSTLEDHYTSTITMEGMPKNKFRLIVDI